jgi:hypothetical protein
VEERDVEVDVALAHAIEAEVLLCELPGVAAEFLAK